MDFAIGCDNDHLSDGAALLCRGLALQRYPLEMLMGGQRYADGLDNYLLTHILTQLESQPALLL
jgi:hypothetical protein